jgi:hypothetical protein
MENKSDEILRNISFTKMESSKLINYCTRICCDEKTSSKSLPRTTGPYPTDVYWWREQYFSEIKCRCHRQILHELRFQQSHAAIFQLVLDKIHFQTTKSIIM